AADERGAAQRRMGGGEPERDGSRECARGGSRRGGDRCVSWAQVRGARGVGEPGDGCQVLAVATGQRDGELHQSGSAGAGAVAIRWGAGSGASSATGNERHGSNHDELSCFFSGARFLGCSFSRVLVLSGARSWAET